MNRDQLILDALSEAQAELDEESDLYAFYHRLLERIVEKKETLSFPLDQLYQEDQAMTLVKAGEPHLMFDALQLDSAEFYPWLLEIAALFYERDPGVMEEVEELEEGSVVEVTRRWYEQGISGLGPTIDTLLANAMAPYLQRAAERLETHLPLEQWDQIYCPICGGYPDFMLWDGRRNRRTLICERCLATWRTVAENCLYCGEDDPELFGFYSTEDQLYRVEVCDTCGNYIKGANRLVAKDMGIEIELAAERLLTPGLDLMGAQEGYKRPLVFGHVD